MKLKNILLVVKDLESSLRFYHDLFGLEKIRDLGGNIILTEGLVLQEEALWKEFLGKELSSERNASLLYFEERDIEGFLRKLESLYPGSTSPEIFSPEDPGAAGTSLSSDCLPHPSVRLARPLTNLGDGRKAIYLYDPDGNLLEVRTPESPSGVLIPFPS